ncbi:MAG TPA: XRE family transcriptional regulator [Acidobacteriaceae bacterium]|nr:XRE family transcriptional regulator [Acidobacteriaceae bacterium]
MAAERQSSQDWAERIRRLLDDLKLTQSALAARLGVSPATVSRWVQGKHEPTAETYVALGNLAPRDESVYFWGRAGMDMAGLSDTGLRRVVSSLRAKLEDFKVVSATKQSHPIAGNAVAIPLLNVAAYGDRVPPRENVQLSDATVQDLLLAPAEWCPHPESVLGMHLRGDSMLPVIPPDSLVFVDTACTDRDKLHQRLTVVSHRDLGYKIARFQRISGADLLVSANHKYAPLDVSNASKWKVFGEVLWWISRDGEAKN